MDLNQALDLRAIVSDSLISGGTQPVSFAAGTPAAAATMATAVPQAVNGVGVSAKEDGRHYIKIFTREALPVDTAYLASYYGVSSSDIEVENAGEINFANDWKKRPVYPGVSTAHRNVPGGTLGCFVRDKSRKLYILGNNHTLADYDRAKAGDPVLQPGIVDGGNENSDIIAILTRAMPLSERGINKMDAAIAEVNAGINVRYTIGGGTRVVDQVVEPLLNMNVEKYGRTTGLTKGRISTTHIIMRISSNGRMLTFDNQVEVKASGRGVFTAAGDSGALILVDNQTHATALLFASKPDGSGYASPLQPILSAFDVTIAMS